MTLLAAALLAAVQPVGPPTPQAETEEGRAAECQVAARRSPQAALANANRWRAAGGGLHARQCIGLAYVELEQWRPAATTFEQAAQEADRNSDARGADFWVQAGNAWLAGGDPVRAVVALDLALKSRHLTSELRGEPASTAPALSSPRTSCPRRASTSTPRCSWSPPIRWPGTSPPSWHAARRTCPAPAPTSPALSKWRARTRSPAARGTIAGQAGDMAEAERLYRQVATAPPTPPAGRAARESLATAAKPHPK
jgi:tetratricopeptide (TPR) repeat protein